MKKCICCGLGYVDDGGDDICTVCGGKTMIFKTTTQILLEELTHYR